MAGRIWRFGIAGVAAAVVAAFAIAWRPAIAPTSPPDVRAFDAGQIARGAALAAIGNCIVCHTNSAAPPFSGGVAVPTPFGVIYSTNITPDADTGIGRWSEAAFRRAMGAGVDREGRYLYPAFPYDHFTKLTDADDEALYAYLMSRNPVRAEAPPNQLPFPLNLRILMAGWNLLFFHAGAFTPDTTQSAAWNRGAYLVEGLAHCGACHTPRNILGAEKVAAPFDGGTVENWDAYALNRNSPAPVPWDQDALAVFLRRGWHPAHGMARGPMAPVVSNLAAASDEDVQAIATYMASRMGAPSAAREQNAADLLARAANPPAATDAGTAGSLIYTAACAPCHDGGRPMPYGGMDLDLSTATAAADARNLVNVVLYGLPPSDGAHSPIMPGFANSMSDGQVTALVRYLRSRFGAYPQWDNLEKTVHDARQTRVALYPTPAMDETTGDPTQRNAP